MTATLSVLAAGACSADDESTSDVSEASSERSGGESGGLFESDAAIVADPQRSSGGDAEAPAATVAPADVEAPAEADSGAVAAEYPASTEEAAGAEHGDRADAYVDDESAPAEAPAAASPDDAEGGLFGADEVSSPDPTRLEGNTFRDYGYRDFVDAEVDPLSTFALDVDTGSFTVGRRWLDEGVLPPIESVRPEEYINAFRYDYRVPRSGLELSVDGGPSPFEPGNYLVRVGVQGAEVDDDERRPAALTFVVDTSGSMDRDDRLGLVKRSLMLLVDELDPGDTVAIVTYDDRAGIVLEPTPVDEKDTILDAIDRLRPGGSTNLESGLRIGYELAGQAFRRGGINRVVLASDGVANVGVTDPAELARLIGDDAERGIDLVTVGFGMGNYNDVTMEQLADQGDGFYAYVDTDDEAERLFEDELISTLVTIAKNAKIQVEFDPDVVASYRLIGFENRGVHDADFRNDRVDAGELGAGHQVTAMYEVELAQGVTIDDRGALGEVYLRWEDPDTGDVDEIDDSIRLRDVEPDWTATEPDFRLATVAATFAELLRDNPYADRVDIDDLADEADAVADVIADRDTEDLAVLVRLAADLR